MNRIDAEQFVVIVKALLSESPLCGGESPYGEIEIVGTEEPFRVAYRNHDDGVWWELTDVQPKVAAATIRRWDSPRYRALRPKFDALLAVAYDLAQVLWVDPPFDVVRVRNGPSGVMRITRAVDPVEYRLIWQSNDVPAMPELDLTDETVESAVERIFGKEGITALERSWLRW